ncbi:MAG: hypothetical protein JJ895_15530 [Balneolaceae bacterium]|nr:hypothetical protein [Balneolaceae bacterium]
MKNYKVKYTKGHLVDDETGKMIFLKRGGTFNILGDDDQFEEKDQLHTYKKPLNSDEKLNALKKENGSFRFEKIAEAGTEFIYRIGLRKITDEDKAREFFFNAIIKEYLYLKSKVGEKWNLCDCLCETSECLEGDVQMYEDIEGTSLSNLFGNVVTFYFSFQRSTSCNAFTTFYINEKTYNPTLDNLKYNNYMSLDKIRSQVIEKFR